MTRASLVLAVAITAAMSYGVAGQTNQAAPPARQYPWMVGTRFVEMMPDFVDVYCEFPYVYVSNRARNAQIDHWIAFVVGVNGAYWSMGSELSSGEFARLLSFDFKTMRGDGFDPRTVPCSSFEVFARYPGEPIWYRWSSKKSQPPRKK